MHPFSLCLQRNLFSTEDIFNSLLRLASNRSGGVGGGRASKEKTSVDRGKRDREAKVGGREKDRPRVR